LVTECPNLGRFLTQLQFTLDLENDIMGRILDEAIPADQAARDWLAGHSDVLASWLEGVSTIDGRDGVEAVRAHLSL
jgi:glycine betaine/proline transport system substrate-binding protein